MVNRITTGINQYTQQEAIKDAQALQKALALQAKQPSLTEILDGGSDASAQVEVSADSQLLLGNLDLAKTLAPQVPEEADDVERQNRVEQLKALVAGGDIGAYLESIGGSKALADALLQHPLGPQS